MILHFIEGNESGDWSEAVYAAEAVQRLVRKLGRSSFVITHNREPDLSVVVMEPCDTTIEAVIDELFKNEILVYEEQRMDLIKQAKESFMTLNCSN